MWGRNWELCWGVGEVLGMWGSMGEVWKSVSGECGGCVEVRESALGCVEIWGSQHTLLNQFSHPSHSPDTSSHTHPTPLPRTPTLT